jgi:hypothetical protein
VAVSCQAQGSWRDARYCCGVDVSASLFVESSKIYTRLNQIQIGSAQTWSVRYKGMLRTSQIGNYTFFFAKSSCELCKLTFFINGSSISFNNVNNFQNVLSATINILFSNNLHDISIWYQQTYYLEPLVLLMTYSFNSESPQTLPSSNLFPLAGRFIVKAVPLLTSELRAELFTITRNPALTATFYSGLDFVRPFRVQDYGSSYLECGVDCMPLDPVAIRWSGFYQESAFSTLSVSFGGSFCQFSLKIWLDNTLYADITQPTDDWQGSSRYINFRSPNPSMAHDLRIEYSKLRGDALFSLNFTENEYSESLGVLYSKSLISSLVGTMEVLSSVACASRSALISEASVATVGKFFFATVTVADSFGNSVNSALAPKAFIFSGPCSNLSSLTPVLTSSTDVSHIYLNVYNVSARLSSIDDVTTQGSQVCLRLFLTQSDPVCLNATIRMLPDRPCASLSSSVGTYISLGALDPPQHFILISIFKQFILKTWFAATAGVSSQFSILARDRFGNRRFGNAGQDWFSFGPEFSQFSINDVISSGGSILPLLAVQILTTVSGRHSLSVLLSDSQGVLVEYFPQAMYWSAPIYSAVTSGILPDEHYSVLANNVSLMMLKYARVGVRWTGFLRVRTPQLLTFLLNASGISTLYVDCICTHECLQCNTAKQEIQWAHWHSKPFEKCGHFISSV